MIFFCDSQNFSGYSRSLRHSETHSQDCWHFWTPRGAKYLKHEWHQKTSIYWSRGFEI